jgi:hypothetical protein
MLRKLDLGGLLRNGHAMVCPPGGEETKSKVVQNSENRRPWRVEGLTDLARGRISLLVKKSENCITKIVLRGLSRPLVILNSLPACSKSRCPRFNRRTVQGILVITLFKFGGDLCVRFPVKTRVSNHGSLLEQEGHS